MNEGSQKFISDVANQAALKNADEAFEMFRFFIAKGFRPITLSLVLRNLHDQGDTLKVSYILQNLNEQERENLQSSIRYRFDGSRISAKEIYDELM